MVISIVSTALGIWQRDCGACIIPSAGFGKHRLQWNYSLFIDKYVCLLEQTIDKTKSEDTPVRRTVRSNIDTEADVGYSKQ